MVTMSKPLDMDTVRARILDRIQGLCEAQKVSQSELARRVGVERQAVGKWLTQRTHLPNEVSMLHLASALTTSVSYLFGDTDDPRPARQWYAGDDLEKRVLDARELLRQADFALSGQSYSQGISSEAMSREEALAVFRTDMHGESYEDLHAIQSDDVKVAARTLKPLRKRP